MEYVDGGGISVRVATIAVEVALAAVGGLIAIKASINATRVLGGYAGKYFPKKSLQSVLKAVGIKKYQ